MTVAKADAELREALELITSIHGVADRTAIKLLGELATWFGELNPRQLVAMVGLDPRPVESGQYAGQRKMSKQGNSHVRATLFMAAHNAVMYELAVKAFYEALISRGKHHMKAMVAVMRKLLHTVYGMLKHKRAFDPELFRRSEKLAA